MKPTIPNIIFKSALWLKQNRMEDEANYLIQYYTLNEDQRNLFASVNDKSIYGTFEGKGEGKHG